jgi:single-stranded-DNA-specific exonuclease
MAAGFSIPPENIPAFRRGLARAVAAARAALPLVRPTLQIDAYLAWEELSLETVAQIERLAPFGPGNPPLALASRGLRLASQAALGREQAHLLLTVEDERGVARRVVWWGGADLIPAGGLPQGMFDLAYRAHSRSYRGADELQLELVDFRPTPGAVEVAEFRPLVEDYRLEAHPRPVLQRLLAEPLPGAVRVWVEGQAAEKLAAHIPAGLAQPRHALDQSLHTLVIWTPPASPGDLREVLQRLRPQRVVLFAVQPEEASWQVFSRRLAGLARHVLGRPDGRASLRRMAAAVAQRELTVLRGLEWLAAQGHFSLQVDEDEVQLTPGGEPEPQAVEVLAGQLSDLLEETRAYRAYFRRSPDPLG